MDFAKHQGQDGNRQMIRIALQKIDVPDLPSTIQTVHIFHGRKDQLVSEGSCQKLVDEWKGRAVLHSVEDTDHNTVMLGERLHTVLITL